MKIVGVEVFQVDSPFAGGLYRFSGGGTMKALHRAARLIDGMLTAPNTPGPGVSPDVNVLGDPVARYS